MAGYTRFFTTSFGARIAYATLGQGPPLIVLPPLSSHIELFMEERPFRVFNEALAADFTLIRYDRYGCGLSDRNRTDFRWELDFRVLDELIAHLDLHKTALYGVSGGGSTAIRYAVAHPERISHLFLKGIAWEPKPDAIGQAVNQMIRADWRMGANTFADHLLPTASPENRQIFARIVRESATPEMMVGLRENGGAHGLIDLLPQLRVPTLVVAPRDDHVVPLESACELARRIPNASLCTLEGDCYIVEFGEIEPMIRAMRAFALGEVPAAPPADRFPAALGLTAREAEVLALVARGLTDAEVAARLNLARRTVGTHLTKIYAKLDVPTRTAAARIALDYSAR